VWATVELDGAASGTAGIGSVVSLAGELEETEGVRVTVKLDGTSVGED